MNFLCEQFEKFMKSEEIIIIIMNENLSTFYKLAFSILLKFSKHNIKNLIFHQCLKVQKLEIKAENRFL